MIILTSGARVLLEVIGVRAIRFPYILVDQKQSSEYEFQKVWHSNGLQWRHKQRNLVNQSFSSKCKKTSDSQDNGRQRHDKRL